MENKREDIELLAKALNDAYIAGRNASEFVSITINEKDKWTDWIKTAEEKSAEIYGPLLEACKNCYRKHVLEDENIGWESLGDQIGQALATVMGEEEYNKWMRKENTRR